MDIYTYINKKPFYIKDEVFAKEGDYIYVGEDKLINMSNAHSRIYDPTLDRMAELAQSLVKSEKNWTFPDEVATDKVDVDNVNHPAHYTKHPSGVECIDITRHYCFAVGNAIKYLWRAGLKKDASLDDKEKEVEDLKKAIWYINDRIKQLENGNV